MTARLYAGGKPRIFRLSGKHRVTLALPGARRTALLTLVDRAGNGTGHGIRFRS